MLMMIGKMKVSHLMKNEQDENIMLSERGEMIMDMLTDIGSTFAIYSPSNANELFYLCKLIKTGVSVSNMVDENGHTVTTGDSYIFCQYYEKIKEKRNCIEYKLLQPDLLSILCSNERSENYSLRISVSCLYYLIDHDFANDHS